MHPPPSTHRAVSKTGAPAGAAFLFWAPHARPNDSGSDRRGAAGTDRPRSRAPHALLCRRLCGVCGPCAWYSFKRRSGSITVANWMLAPPRAQLENALEKGATMITGFRRTMGNRIGTPYAADAAMQGVELLREFTKIRRYHLPCRMRPSCSLVRAESAQIRLIC